MNIVLLGPPGAGKGTQAKKLAEKINLPHIATGDLLRQNVAAGTALGKEAKNYMDKGALVPDTLVSQMLSERFKQPDVKRGFILDGYPRNLAQAQTLDAILKEKGIPLDMVMYLDTSESVIIQRLSGRLVCKGCGANFHVKNMPPRKEMVCDFCGGELYQRSDDNETTIKTRLAVYQKEAGDLINYYAAKGKLERISADADAETVLTKMIKLVERHNDSLKI